ncbi:MAG: RNB domain-containing ribonuclease [Proteobacteria bacterium]|nr:RNB domain-containing ribonuclease [Pseudomonadota bacterium]
MNQNFVTGSIVEYEQHAKSILAAIITEKKGKFLLITEHNSQVELPENRLYLLPQNLPKDTKSNDDIAKYLKSIKEQSLNIANSINLEELYEILDNQKAEISVQDLTELCFNNNSMVNHLAMRTALLSEQVYFKRIKDNFATRDLDVVNELKNKQRIENEKRELYQILVERLVERLKNHDVELPDSIAIIEEYAALGKSAKHAREAANIVEEVILKAKLNLTEKFEFRAFQLLVLAKHFTSDQNLTLIRLGRREKFNKGQIAEAEKLAIKTDFPLHLENKNLFTITIDSEETKDIDDALSLKTVQQGFELGIHISDVSSIIPQNSPLEKEAFYRATSIYCPDQHVPMLPAIVSQNSASLQQDCPRPVMSFYLQLDSDFRVISKRIALEIIVVDKRLSYNFADQILYNGSPEQGDLEKMLFQLWDIASALEVARLERGAYQFPRRTVNPKLEKDNKITLEEYNEDTPAHKLVGEFMVLANHCAAEFGVENKLPLVYRSQDKPDVNIDAAIEKYPEGPAREFHKRSFIRRSITSVEPKLHFGLGLSSYLQITSPIRRALDLLNQRQISNYLLEGKPLYSKDEMIASLENVEVGLDQAMLIQRERNKYYLLKYLKQEKIKEITGTIVKVDGPKPLVEIEILFMLNPFYPAPEKKANLKKRIGEVIKLRIDSIIPREDVLILKEISE